MRYSRALVTGASSGIGRALCELLAEEGIPLLITARDRERLKEIQSDLGKKVDVQIFVADLSVGTSRASLLASISGYAPDLIINNAGFGLYGPALSHSTADLSTMLDVNAKAVLEITLESAKWLTSTKRKGTIVNISSAASFFPFPYFSVYAASKSFVTIFSESLDRELAPSGIRVLTACPGMVNTSFRARASKGLFTGKIAFGFSQELAARKIYEQIKTGKSLSIFTRKYKLAVLIGRFLPHRIREKILARSLSKRFPINSKM
ncbi:MAG: SDR family NAD(P)-dependent oxidoreductase [Chlamydiae bacterium]|jgi:short-subunit dehydrogenase|nr:SDR family NAD(P)-dependent oxidoreductase [Chlamydiota bacterium]